MRSEDMGWVRSMAGMWVPPCLASSLPSTWYTLTAAPGLWDQAGVRPAGLRWHLIVGKLRMLSGGCMAPEQGTQDASSTPSRAAAVRATAEKGAPVAGSGCQREADVVRFRLHPPALELRSGQPKTTAVASLFWGDTQGQGIFGPGAVAAAALLVVLGSSGAGLGLVWGGSEPERRTGAC